MFRICLDAAFWVTADVLDVELPADSSNVESVKHREAAAAKL